MLKCYVWQNFEFSSSCSELPDIPPPSATNARSTKRKEKPCQSTSYDASDSLFSTLDGESSAILKLNPPRKRTKLSEISFSSSEGDEVLGQIHPSEKSKTKFFEEEQEMMDPSSPLDRSTPISDYEDDETGIGTGDVTPSETAASTSAKNPSLAISSSRNPILSSSSAFETSDDNQEI